LIETTKGGKEVLGANHPPKIITIKKKKHKLGRRIFTPPMNSKLLINVINACFIILFHG
jgi:hypothetical protein